MKCKTVCLVVGLLFTVTGCSMFGGVPFVTPEDIEDYILKDPVAPPFDQFRSLRFDSDGNLITTSVDKQDDKQEPLPVPEVDVVVVPPSQPKPEVVVPEVTAQPGYMVQLVSLRTATQAQAAWRQFSRAHAVLDGLPHRVERAELDGRGVFYRLRVGPFADRATALKLCRDLTARQLNCWITSGTWPWE